MASAVKKVVLITGANSGVGFELAAQLLAKGTYHVLLGARSKDKGQAALQDLQSRQSPGSIEFLPIDVTDDATIENAASSVQQNHGKLDILVNNAAISDSSSPTLRGKMQDCFNANSTGPLIVTDVFGPLLKKSSNARIINITSGAGSLTRRADPTGPLYKMQGHQYRASKVALNMITLSHFVEYEPFGVKVFGYDPGFTISNLGPHNNVENGARSPRESVLPLVDVIEGKRDEEVGKVLHNTGQWPW